MPRTAASITPDSTDFQPSAPSPVIRCCFRQCQSPAALGFPFCAPHFEFMSGGEKVTESAPLYETASIWFQPEPSSPSRPAVVPSKSLQTDPGPESHKRKRLSGIKVRKTAPGATVKPSLASYQGKLSPGRDAKSGIRRHAEAPGAGPGIYSPPLSPSLSSSSRMEGVNPIGQPPPETPRRPDTAHRILKQKTPSLHRNGRDQKAHNDEDGENQGWKPITNTDSPPHWENGKGRHEAVFGSGGHASANRPLQEWFVSKWNVGSELSADFAAPDETSPSQRRPRPTTVGPSSAASRTPQRGRNPRPFEAGVAPGFSPASLRISLSSEEQSDIAPSSRGKVQTSDKGKEVPHLSSSSNKRLGGAGKAIPPLQPLQPSLDTWIYSHSGARAPKGVVLEPEPQAEGQTATLFAHIDPRIHWNLPRSPEWYEAKQAEIKKRGSRKANFGKAAQRMAQERVAPVPLATCAPEYVRENPAWMRAVEWFDECDRLDREGKIQARTARGTGGKERGWGPTLS